MPFCQRCDLYEAYPNSCSCDASKGLADVPISGDDSSSNENSARNGMAHTIPVSDENLMRSIHAVDFTNQVHPPCLTLSMRDCFYYRCMTWDCILADTVSLFMAIFSRPYCSCIICFPDSQSNPALWQHRLKSGKRVVARNVGVPGPRRGCDAAVGC